jgi:hypothetical protein
MKTKSTETLRAMTREGILMYCQDCHREIATLRESKSKLLRRVEELERICATLDPKLQLDPPNLR